MQETRVWSDPWVGNILWRRKWQTTPYSCWQNSMGRGALQATVLGISKSQTRLSTRTHTCRQVPTASVFSPLAHEQKWRLPLLGLAPVISLLPSNSSPSCWLDQQSNWSHLLKMEELPSAWVLDWQWKDGFLSKWYLHWWLCERKRNLNGR